MITDAAGRADLGSQPFGPSGVVHTYGQSNGVLALRIRVGQRVGVQFLGIASFNLEYGRGHTGQAIYPVTLSTWTTVSTALTIERLFLPNLQHP